MDIFRECKLNSIVPNSGTIKKELSRRLNDKPEPIKVTLFDFIETFISVAHLSKKPATIKAYKTTFNHLKTYSTANKEIVDFEQIDLDFHAKFLHFLTHKKGLAQNTLGKNIQTLKIFMNASTEAGLNENMAFRSRKFNRPTEDVAKIYLNEAEILRLYQLDLSANKRLEKARDLFIIGLYTGLRFSDFTELRPENISGDYLSLKTKKTGEAIVLPFRGRLKEIYIKYNNQFPSRISNQKMNDYLKELGQLAQINDTVVISKRIKGIQVDKVYKKYELISCHTARRSFASNAFLSGLPSISIMKITGHKTEKIFLGYIKVSKSENASALVDHPFFNQ